MKIYTVSYVGLSQDYDANGYNKVKTFNTIEKAKKAMGDWIESERENLKGMEADIDEEEISDRYYRVFWAGYSEQVIIQIHETELY